MSYQEYPKWVSVKGLDPVLCHDAKEEAALLDKPVATVEKQAEKHIADGEAVQAETDRREIEAIEAKGTAVSEADMVKLTDKQADDLAKRGPGRPKKD